MFEADTLSFCWNKARGHCHRISNIYDKYLDKWLSSILNTEEHYQLWELFDTFINVERGFVYSLNSITEWLVEQAGEVLDLVENSNYDLANQKVGEVRWELNPIRKRMKDAMAQMLEIENRLIEMTGIV